MTVFNDWLTRRRRYAPDRTAIDDEATGRSYRYAELDARAGNVAALLGGPGEVKRGDRVACLSTNRIECIDLYFACGKLGAVFVPLNTRLPAAGVLELLRDCQPRLLVYESAFQAVAEAAERSGTVRRVLPIETDGWTLGCEPSVDVCESDESDVAMILYTSGTTGQPKGAMLSFRQIHWNALNTIIGLQLTENDAAFLNMPLYHTGAWHVLFTPLMLLGGRVVLQERFDAQRCNDRVGPAGVSILFGVPTMLRMMCEAENFATADLSQVRFAICGGEPCPIPLIETYQERGIAIRQGYGLTEAGPNCFSLPAEDATRKQGSIGFPNFFIDAKLVDDHGEEVGVGEVGELWMKGPHVFAGYWRNDKETSNAFRDGWAATGDLMKRDREGYYFVVGRKKEMYISGGENVYPSQVEGVLRRHSGVALAAVVSVPHPKWGECGCAFIQPHEDHQVTEEQLLGWCKQHLATFQCPARIVIVKDLPIGHSGKIDKLALRNRAGILDGIW